MLFSLAISARILAAAAKADAAATSDHNDGVAMFTLDSNGLMFEA